ncbi:hypothetical protein J5N97_003328 [Dioscorea zingiberensis]|uniref:Transmembrane protein n=1 Tax=Dioscorea zingiberensis TaxID=325984 RepID=A0A9D5D5Y4_9LILI|nr:hypothetical protein J5N97_003328 [Dioscorea zingiberensis]
MDSRSGVMTILREAMSIPKRNKKLMIPVMLLTFIPSSFLLMGNYVSIIPLLLNFIIKLYLLSSNHASNPEFYDILVGLKKDAEALLHVDMVFTISLYIISVFSMILIIHATSMVHSGKQLTIRDLLSMIKRRWKGPLVTRVYFTILYIGYTVLSVSFISILMLNATGSIGMYVFGGFIALVARLLYAYLAMVWTMGLVISVLDDSCCGLEAMGRAGELIRGKRLQGFFIAFILLCVDTVLIGGYSLIVSKIHPQLEVQKASAMLMLNVSVLLKIFSQMVYTVFYHDCKRSQGKLDEELRSMIYTRVPSSPIVDEV